MEMNKRLMLTAISVFIVLPIIIALTLKIEAAQKPLFLSLIFIVIAIVPFFVSFEKTKPKAREITIIAVYTAITVVCNFLSASIVPFQAGTALIILAGVTMGCQSGFLIGCLARFIINLFFIQGMWTLWQMLGWGIIGFLAGLILYRDNNQIVKQIKNNKYYNNYIPNKDEIKKISVLISLIIVSIILSFVIKQINVILNVYILGLLFFIISLLFIKKIRYPSVITTSIFSFLATLLIYGGLLNLSTVIMVGGTITKETFEAIYIAGFPFDILHAIGCSMFIIIFSPIIIGSINRIKIKYNISE